MRLNIIYLGILAFLVSSLNVAEAESVYNIEDAQTFHDIIHDANTLNTEIVQSSQTATAKHDARQSGLLMKIHESYSSVLYYVVWLQDLLSLSAEMESSSDYKHVITLICSDSKNTIIPLLLQERQTTETYETLLSNDDAFVDSYAQRAIHLFDKTISFVKSLEARTCEQP